ncbi:MAG: hypothetical protein R3296_07520 [Oleiphilaceae bacterium]|nr:hypothetical protein [Oleiphilaceae bacterium]
MMANALQTLMAPARQRWQQARQRFSALEKREKALAFVAVLVLCLLGGWQFLVAPVLKIQGSVATQRQSLTTEMAALRQSRDDLAATLAVEPGDNLRQRQRQLKQRLERLDREIAGMTTGLIDPSAMVDLLRDMLSEHRGVRLMAVTHEKPRAMGMDGEPPVSDTPDNGSQLYAHGVTVRIRGEYRDILQYLEAMESLDNRLGWRSLDYQVQDWPTGEAMIRLQTLSLSKEWLGV